MGRVRYIYPHSVDLFYGISVGKYTSPMDAMGMTCVEIQGWKQKLGGGGGALGIATYFSGWG